MTSLALAWVTVTMINKGLDEIQPFIFVVTGLVDALIFYNIFN